MSEDYPLPQRDELEISIFGPGYGECVLIHYGDGKWINIDSCINPQSKEPQSLEYLKKMKLDPSKCLKLILCSHWHDDHVRGLDKLYECSKDAKVVFSSCLSSKEFLTLLKAYSTNTMMASTGLNVLNNIIQINKEREDNKIVFASAGKLLLKDSVKGEPENLEIEFWALSPSDHSVKNSYTSFSNLIPKANLPKRHVNTFSPNDTSIVVQLTINDESYLLGADLEESGNVSIGWSAVLNSDIRPSKKSSVFKVPHHGSQTAHLESVWTDMLHENPIALLTPFNRSKLLPSDDDVKRISSYSQNIYISAEHTRVKKQKYDKVIEKMLKDNILSRRLVIPEFGQVQIRKKMNSREDFKVRLFGSAKKI
ncbi:MAG: hypothetical protein IAE90_09525 [Ignavibacteria bacterium]|nr:hypothetical protein [Ignavibacteria bacterium]